LLNRLAKLLKRQFIRLFFFSIWSLSSAIFYGSLEYYLRSNQFLYLATLCLPVLAILFGFSALLYNRSRALQPGPAQRRSLYAAERSMQATILFLLGIASGAIIATIAWKLKIDFSKTSEPDNLFIFFIVPIMLVLFSFGSFFFAVRAISHRMVKILTPRELLRRVR
jgi:hypothetical protein